MNAESNSGAEPETQTPPTIEAGCEIEIDRNVLGTGGTTGFAELRARVMKCKSDADARLVDLLTNNADDEDIALAVGIRSACIMFASWIDELSGCEG